MIQEPSHVGLRKKTPLREICVWQQDKIEMRVHYHSHKHIHRVYHEPELLYQLHSSNKNTAGNQRNVINNL